jgi:acetyl esterase/lipase
MKINMWLITMMILMSTACNKPVNDKPLPAETKKDVAYGTEVKQKFDYYLPADRNINDTKILILLHGGGWIGGDKRDFQQTVDSLKAELSDYAIFNVNYRLATFQGTNLWPTQMNDVNAAVQYIIDHAHEFNINNRKIVIAGNNAKNANLPFLLSVFLGGTPESNKYAFDAASPVNNITAAAPPTLILHGTNDRTVPVRQSELLKKELDLKAVKNEFVLYEGAGHGWYGKNLSDTYDKMVNFIRQNVD